MSARKLVAVVVVVVWTGALAWYGVRLYVQPEAERLAAAARSLPPGPAYYAVYRDDRQMGWAQSELDTLPDGGGFRQQDLLEMDLAALGQGLSGRLEFRSRAVLGPALGLRDFEIDASSPLGDVRADGEVEGDSVLAVELRRDGGGVDRRRIPLDGPVIMETALALRLAADGRARAGTRYRVLTLDPMEMRARDLEVEVLATDVRSYPDSADRHEETGEWFVAGRDTVRAWQVARELAGVRLLTWIDEDGRILEMGTEDEGGFRLERTAFELAYFGRPGAER